MTTAAIETLKIARDVCVTNAPINEARGDTDQANLERRNIVDFDQAIEILEKKLDKP